MAWGEHGKEDGQFDACVGIAIGPNDEIYTAEFRNQRVQRFTPEGKFLGAFPVQPHAGGLAVDREGNVYVAHWNSNKVAAYSPSGRSSANGDRREPATASFSFPAPSASDRTVCFTCRIRETAASRSSRGRANSSANGGSWEASRDSSAAASRWAGASPDRSSLPSIATATSMRPTRRLDRVQKFTADGELLAYWGNESSEPGGFGPPPLNKDGTPGMGGPISLCVDRRDRVWVSATNNRVQQFTNAGKYLRGIGGRRTDPGRFHLPHGIAIDSRDCLYVADTMNSRIQKFAAG